MTKRILLFLSNEYINLSAIHSTLQRYPDSTFHLASRATVGLSRVLLPSKLFPITPIKWRPSYSTKDLDSDFARALLFWDGIDRLIIPSLEFFIEHRIPFTILDGEMKEVALTEFYATFSKGDPMSSTTPAVIVDSAPQAPVYGQGQSVKDTKVRILIHLPEAIVAVYDQQAKSVKLPLEKVLSDRLRGCVEHTSGRGLYFNDEQRSHLERITGGHIIPNATIALEKIHTVVNLRVAGIEIELTERVLARCASRAKSERKPFEDYVKKEVILNLERSVGLRPW